jgi:hypothetical protein
MRTTRPARRQRRIERLAHWVETLWACKCAYTNVAAYRCHGCGARPPRRLRAKIQAPWPVEEPADVEQPASSVAG